MMIKPRPFLRANPYSFILVISIATFCLKNPLSGEEKDDLKPKDQDIHLKLYEGEPPGKPVLPEGKPVPKMSYGKYQVYRNVHKPAIDIYQAEGDTPRAAIIICPGGSYGGLVYGREGINTAKWFRKKGITTAVLRYRIKPYRHPVPMSDVQRAIQVVRANAEKWNIDPKRIGIMGFSAGGHAASTATVYHLQADPKSEDPIKKFSSRPDFSVLVYPVIAMHSPETHLGSQKNLLGANPAADLIEETSSYKHVNENTPPTLLVHSKDDEVVPIKNCQLFLEALTKSGVKGKLLTYETGGHGYGIGRKKTDPNAAWPSDCMKWLTEIGVTK